MSTKNATSVSAAVALALVGGTSTQVSGSTDQDFNAISDSDVNTFQFGEAGKKLLDVDGMDEAALNSEWEGVLTASHCCGGMSW